MLGSLTISFVETNSNKVLNQFLSYVFVTLMSFLILNHLCYDVKAHEQLVLVRLMPHSTYTPTDQRPSLETAL